MNKKKILLLLGVGLLIGLFFIFDLQSYFDLEYFQQQRQKILAFTADNFFLSRLIYFCLYVVVAALSLPAAAVLTVIGGAIFGFVWGLLLVSFASTLGATLAFLIARTVLRGWVQDRFGDALSSINRGIEKDGNYYLFTLRLIPVFPFFLVNILMALTPIRTGAFYLVSQAGMLFGTALYVNIGAELGMATSITGILSFGVIRAIVVLALFPWLARAVVGFFRSRKILGGYSKPKKFDANLVVIGAGSAGLVTAYMAALARAKVILIEKNKMGGDCLNSGCIPSKTFIRSAGEAYRLDHAHEFGIENVVGSVNFQQVMERVRNVIDKVAPHDSEERYTQLGVECIKGRAFITSPYSVKVDERKITTRAIVLATGASPIVPPVPGLGETGYLTSDTIWNLQQLPGKLLIVGAGAIGCELAQAFARLGSAVTLVENADRILPGEDKDVSRITANRFSDEGIDLLTAHKVIRFERKPQQKVAVLETKSEVVEVEFDEVLLSVGRKANVSGFGLEELGIPLTAAGAIEVNDYLQTQYPNIFACGDVAGSYQFTHMAAFEAWYASVNSLFGRFKKFRINYSVVPRAIFIDPEVARVGLNENEAQAQAVSYEVSNYGMDDLDRAIVDGETQGFVKVLTVPGSDRILGVVIVGHRAAELIGEFVMAMTHGLGLKKVLSTIHIYPTYSESNRHAAGQWRKQHAPAWLLPWLERFHRWLRS